MADALHILDGIDIATVVDLFRFKDESQNGNADQTDVEHHSPDFDARF